MRTPSFFVLILCLLVAAPSAKAQQPTAYYVYHGTTLQIFYDNPAHAQYSRWQVWLFQGGVRIPLHSAGLQYSRWGLIEGWSAESVTMRLKAFQGFEEAYLKFFGSGTWGRDTFFNPIGPIAVTDQAIENQPAVLEMSYQLGELHNRVNRLIASVQPSLENNESEGPGSPLKEYFDQIRDALQQVSKLYGQLARTRPSLQFINNGIARANTAVAQAKNNMSKISAALPSVKLPTSTAWMSHTERAGSDGTIQVAVTEIGSAASVRQTWTGGDGSMAGTVFVTLIPYDDIGDVDLRPPTESGDNTWTVRVRSGRSGFPQTVSSPERRTAKALLSAVNYTTTGHVVHLVFLNSSEAQDAYAYFQYHKQVGR